MPLVPKLNAVGYLLLGPAGPLWRTPGRETTPAEPISYDFVSEFSGTNGNPNGVWSYGQMPLGFGLFSLFPNFNTSVTLGWRGSTTEPAVYVGDGRFGAAVGQIALHPAPTTAPAVVRWTAPTAFSTVQIQGQFLPGDSANVSLTIRRGGTPLWNGSDYGSFDIPLNNIARGTSFDFCAYGAYFNGTTPLEVTITGTP